MAVQVKICGLTTEQSVTTAIEAGADFLGFVDYPLSPRHITPAEVAENLLPLIPGTVRSVIVTINPDDDWIKQVVSHVAPDAIQLHGNESPEQVAQIKAQCGKMKLIKAIAVRNADDLTQVADYAKAADMLLFDAKPTAGALPGGNGVPFDWKILKDLSLSVPWFLSGGLTAENIGEALLQSGADYVDVSSGVESSPGVKDKALIKEFIQAAKA